MATKTLTETEGARVAADDGDPAMAQGEEPIGGEPGCLAVVAQDEVEARIGQRVRDEHQRHADVLHGKVLRRGTRRRAHDDPVGIERGHLLDEVGLSFAGIVGVAQDDRAPRLRQRIFQGREQGAKEGARDVVEDDPHEARS